jgi:hypothetical protein
MFQASVDGEPYDADRWGAYYKPAGFQTNATVDGHGDARTSVATAPVMVDDEPDEAPKAASPAPADKAPSQRAEDILAMIRNRQKQ